MSKTLTLVRGAGLGAALMYFFDPVSGRRRRALVRDQVVHLTHALSDALDATTEDLENRAAGLLAEARDLVSPIPVDDAVLVERVRARVGRLLCHPGSIDVTAANGTVTLSGPVLRSEVERLLLGVSAVRGVRQVENHLAVYDQPDDVPGLQGACHPAGEPAGFLEGYWPPTARLLVSLAGGALLQKGLPRRGLLGAALTLAGLGLLARGLTNVSPWRLLGFGAAPPLLRVQKTLNLAAPADEVFTFLSHPENFPRFMSHVREVRPAGPNRFVWTVAGPAGVPVTYETVVTRFVPSQLIEWRSVPGSAIATSGSLRVETEPKGGSRLDLKMSYQPPAGVMGNLVASLFDTALKQALDADMVRFKSLLESGKTTAHHETVTREEIAEADRIAPSNLAESRRRRRQR